MSITRHAAQTGVDPTAPECPGCGRRIGALVLFGNAQRVRHKDPKTGRWCKAARRLA